MSPGIHADPRVNGSIFRINRDTRFSKDKTPYKTHLDLFFWEGEGRSRDCPGFFFRMTPRSVVLGAGFHHFDPERLARFRAAVADEQSGAGARPERWPPCGRREPRSAERRTSAFRPASRRTTLGPASCTTAGSSATRRAGSQLRQQVAPSATWCAERLERAAPVHAWLRDTVFA